MARKRRRALAPTWQYVGLGVLAVVTAGVVGYVVLEPKAPQPVSETVVQYQASPTTAPAVRKGPAELAPTMALLSDASRPWTLAVAGDSTGNAPDEWVYLLAESMSAKYDRPAMIHNWSIDSNSYVDVTTVGKGAGQPIVIWNGSASGKNLEYSYVHRAAIMPERPDLFIVSHGLNIARQDARPGSYKLADWAFSQWPEPPALAITLQNPRTVNAVASKELADSQAAVVATLRTQWNGGGVTLIDVWKAFHDAGPDFTALLRDDGFHPNGQGEIVWVEAVKRALGV